jgi:hypothetical protein
MIQWTTNALIRNRDRRVGYFLNKIQELETYRTCPSWYLLILFRPSAAICIVFNDAQCSLFRLSLMWRGELFATSAVLNFAINSALIKFHLLNRNVVPIVLLILSGFSERLTSSINLLCSIVKRQGSLASAMFHVGNTISLSDHCVNFRGTVLS